MHVLGIDAGGTKTVCLLADDRGAILSEARGGGANLHAAGELAVEKVLHDVMERAIGDRVVVPAAICLGIAGVDREDEAQVVRAIMRRIGYKSRVLVVNDALIAMVAGARDDPAIVLIAGTGSIAYGRNGSGEAARAGGWGHMIGDEGSGYWIGREALAAVMRGADGRGPETGLSSEILEYFNVKDVSRLPRIVYDREQPRMSVAALGPIVQRVAEQGDAVAMRILERATDELVLAARSVATRLEMRGDPFTFFLAGGAFRVVSWLTEELPRRLVEVAPRSQTEILTAEPALGAVWLALAEAHGKAQVPRYKPVMAEG
ncbi:MAG TPA: BadF/BadG/BcrA/BcrD ATPase family protein [Vicinamibacterales bacterium]|nr:BadF/BadG/BcrA/BcrD ATPase family protein [Vicinamibacterales bacterium]